VALAFDPPLLPSEVSAALGGDIQVIRALQPGGQGAVFVVRHGTATEVLKIYAIAQRTRAERECSALARLDCDAVVQLVSWGEVTIRGEDAVYTLTEFVDGETLRERLKRQVLTEDEARTLGVCVARAIRALWESGRIVHRDIKPDNIMITMTGAAVLLDLGIARHQDLTTLTAQGWTLGTAGYMSPEQARGRKSLTYRSDFFVLGIVLYEAVSGRHPFLFTQDLIGRRNPERLETIAGVSSEFADVVHSLMALNPMDRPHDCVRVVELLTRKERY